MLLKLFQILLSIFLLGCRPAQLNPQETATLVLTQFPKSIDPRITTDATGQRLNHLIYNSLVRVGPNMEIVGDAATNWKLENLTYTFLLAQKLTCSNNRPLSNADILYTFSEYKKDSSVFKSAFDIIENVTSDVESITPQIKITLKKYNANFLSDLSLARILCKTDDDQPLGTGAFFILSQNLNEIILERREHPIYKPKIKYAVFKIIQDDATRFLNAYKGSVDIIQYGLPLNKISYIKSRDRFEIYTYPGPSMNYILLNLKNDKFKNPEFRKALSIALDRKKIIDYKLEGYAEPATSLLPRNNLYHNKSLPDISYSPKEAENIINKLGLKNTEIVFKTSNNPEVVEFAKVISAQLENVGLKIKLQSFEWGTFYGDTSSGNYDMAIMRWIGLSDPDIYRTAFHTKEFPPGRNRGFYSNTQLDKLLDQGIEIRNQQQRINHYNEIQNIIYKENIIIPLWYNTLVDIVHKRIKNYVPPTNGDLSPLYEIEITKQ